MLLGCPARTGIACFSGALPAGGYADLGISAMPSAASCYVVIAMRSDPLLLCGTSFEPSLEAVRMQVSDELEALHLRAVLLDPCARNELRVRHIQPHVANVELDASDRERVRVSDAERASCIERNPVQACRLVSRN